MNCTSCGQNDAVPGESICQDCYNALWNTDDDDYEVGIDLDLLLQQMMEDQRKHPFFQIKAVPLLYR